MLEIAPHARRFYALILHHPLDGQSAFYSAKSYRERSAGPESCSRCRSSLSVRKFDGDLTDWLVAQDIAKPFQPSPCFNTNMFAAGLEGVMCGINPWAIGGMFSRASGQAGLHFAQRRALRRPP